MATRDENPDDRTGKKGKGKGDRPSKADSDQNAKEKFVAAIVDHRSPWIFFDEAVELKEQMTDKFYRIGFHIPKKHIDNEHTNTTYDPKYKKVYDERPLAIEDLDELNTIIRDNPWNDDRMERVLTKLHDGCEEHTEENSELYKEMLSLQSDVVGRPSAKMKKKMEEIDEQQSENWEWFKSFDRRVYLLHVQMAAQVDKNARNELIERYHFQMEVQRLFQESRTAFKKADAHCYAYLAAARGEIRMSPDFTGEVIQVLRESWKILKNIIKAAREINLSMKNFEGKNLAEFVLEENLVPEPPIGDVKFVWTDKLLSQLSDVRHKCFRLHFQNLGGILRLQEQVAAKWMALREPISAEVVEAEPIPAEMVEPEPKSLDTIKSAINSMGGVDAVLARAMSKREGKSPEASTKAPETKTSQSGEPIPAEIIPAEIIPAEIIPAEIIPAEVVTEELPPESSTPVRPTVPEPSKAMAAFTLTPIVVPPLPQLLSPPPVASSPPPPRTQEEPAPESPPVAAEKSLGEEQHTKVESVTIAEMAAALPTTPEKVALEDALEVMGGVDGVEVETEPNPPSTVVSDPVARSFGSGTSPSGIKPAQGNRPAIRITMVRPGETSPLAK